MLVAVVVDELEDVRDADLGHAIAFALGQVAVHVGEYALLE